MVKQEERKKSKRVEDKKKKGGNRFFPTPPPSLARSGFFLTVKEVTDDSNFTSTSKAAKMEMLSFVTSSTVERNGKTKARFRFHMMKRKKKKSSLLHFFQSSRKIIKYNVQVPYGAAHMTFQ